MFHVCRHKQGVSRTEIDSLVAALKHSGTRMHNVEFVLFMRFLLVTVCWPVVAEFHGAVLEQHTVQTVIRLSDGGKCSFRCHAFDHGFRLECESLIQGIWMMAIIRHLRGVLMFSGFTLNTLFWFVPILVLAILKLLIPVAAVRDAITRVLMALGENWISVNTALLKGAGSVDWRLEGADALRRDEWYLVISNHQTWVDILVLQGVLNRRIPFLKFFIKQQLFWFPVLGIAWWAMDMPFMKRYSAAYLARNPHMKGKDFETTRRACEKFRNTPTSVINFIEGTRFSEEKRARHKDPYRHLLRPRAGGFAVAMSSMGELFGAILDVTLVYPDGPAKFWDMCCGRHVQVIVNVRERAVPTWCIDGDYENDRKYRRDVQSWLGEIWQEKDELIQQTLDSRESHD